MVKLSASLGKRNGDMVQDGREREMDGGVGGTPKASDQERSSTYRLDTGVRWRPDYLPSPRVEPGPAQERGSRSLNQAIDRLAAKLCYLGSWE